MYTHHVSPYDGGIFHQVRESCSFWDEVDSMTGSATPAALRPPSHIPSGHECAVHRCRPSLRKCLDRHRRHWRSWLIEALHIPEERYTMEQPSRWCSVGALVVSDVFIPC